MRKGLGRMMAEVALAAEKARVNEGEAVACPLCWREMEFNGAAWFCEATPHEFTKEQQDAAYQAAERDEMVFFAGPGFWDPDMQGVIVAACIEAEGSIVATFCTVRGAYGRTAWSVRAGDDVERSDVLGLILKYGWTFQDWMSAKE